MAALTCDLCGGKLSMGAGGIATCENCGMEHSIDRMREKVQEIKGVVRVDNTHMIDNYLEMAENAYEANNLKEAENYCNKIIEIETTNYKAWYLKGKAAGWQSSLGDNRFSESVAAFAKAIMNAPEEEKDKIIKDGIKQITDLSYTLVRMRAQRFVKWPDEEEKKGFTTDLTIVMQTIIQFKEQTDVLISPNEILSPLGKLINQAVVEAYKTKILPEYNGDDNRPNKYQLDRYIDQVGYCTELLTQANDLCKDDEEEDIQRYENLIFLHEQAIQSCSWDYNFDSYGYKKYYKDYTLTDTAIQSRRKLIDGYKFCIATCEFQIATKKMERKYAYWIEHAEEKKELEDRKNKALEDIKAYEEEIERIENEPTVVNLRQRINQLQNERDRLGLFKSKEKKAIQDTIFEASNELMEMNKEIDIEKNKINEKIKALKITIKEVDDELNKDR